jgi:ATP-dependent protease HslVU (ClpYQ) peptidase subunit
MTCIVGIAEGGEVWMGADSFFLAGGVVYSGPSKLFRVGDFIIGGAGSWRTSELVGYCAKVQPPESGADIRRYLATDFAKALREAATEYGYMGQTEEGQQSIGYRILIGAQGCLFNFDGVLSHLYIPEGYAAIGSGAEVAMGSLYTTRGSEEGPRWRLERALEAAEALTDGVRRPFTFECL